MIKIIINKNYSSGNLYKCVHNILKQGVLQTKKCKFDAHTKRKKSGCDEIETHAIVLPIFQLINYQQQDDYAMK